MRSGYTLLSRPRCPSKVSRVEINPISQSNMKTTSRNSSRFVLLFASVGLLALGTLTGGCSSTRTRESTGEYVDDTVITTKVKSALLRDDVVKSFAINVETVKGVVQLSGFVDSSFQRTAAENDTSAVQGVREVKNDLIVK